MNGKSFFLVYGWFCAEKLILHSFKDIPHLSCKFEHFWNLKTDFSMNASIWLKRKKKCWWASTPTGAVPLDQQVLGLRTLAALDRVNGMFAKFSSVFCLHEITCFKIDNTKSTISYNQEPHRKNSWIKKFIFRVILKFPVNFNNFGKLFFSDKFLVNCKWRDRSQSQVID